MNNHIFLLLLITILSIQDTNQWLKVLSPDDLVDAFGKAKIHNEIAHFGQVPYGSGIVGFVHRPKDIDACTEVEQIDPYDHVDDQPILQVRRGNCQFFTKALNAQHAGAKMIVIFDNESDTINYYPVSYDRRAQLINIPTIIIGKTPGEEILKILDDASNPDRAKSVILEFELPLPERDEVHMSLVLSAADWNAYSFMDNFQELYQSLGENFHFKPIFFTNSGDLCDKDSNQTLVGQNGEQFCLSTVENSQTYIEMQIYQTCLWTQMTADEFLLFAGLLSKHCNINLSQQQECMKGIAKDFGHRRNRATNKCVEEQQANGYPLQSQMRREIEKNLIYSHPTLIINGKAIYGGLNTENAFNAACEAFVDPPESCAYIQNEYVYNDKINKLVKEHARNEQGFFFINLILILVVFTIAAGLFYLIFKKLYTNIIRTQIDGMVKDSIASYQRMGDSDNDV